MADQGFELDVFRDLLEEAGAVGRLARSEKSFIAAYEAFRRQDPKAFQAALRLRPPLVCRLICEWIRLKECVFLCFELCGPPPVEQPKLDPRLFAEAVVRITSNEKLVLQLVAAIEKRDKAAFQRLVKAQKLGPYCHFFCHWVCFVYYRLVCRWLCEPLAERPNLAAELSDSGDALRALLENRKAFDAAVAASEAGDAEKLKAALGDAGLSRWCYWICGWFCSWRCVLICLTLCREFPLKAIDNELQEALAFGKAVGALADKPAELERLSLAVGAGDVKTFTTLVSELHLQRYCIQLCHWICFLRCRRFCIRVCPPPETIPLFTKVGIYSIFAVDGEFQADGTTTAGGYAFTDTIPLEGTMPSGDSPTAYEYHFRIAKYPNSAPAQAQDVLGAQIPPTVIGQLLFWDYDGANWNQRAEEYWVNNPGAQVTIHRKLQSDLVVDVNKNVKANGWIEVPRDNDFSQGGGGKFVAGGGLAGTDMLARLDTTQFTNEVVDLTVPAPGLKAGDSLAAGVPPHSEKPTYRIFFEAREVGPGPTVSANDLTKIAFSNTTYKYVRHDEWDGGPVSTRTVCSLNVAEMVAPGSTGCDKQHDHVHALYTCYHPYLGSVLLWLQGQGIPTGVGIPPVPVPPAPFSFVPAIVSGESASGPAGHDFNISTLKPCAYILWMSAIVNLTRGDGLISDPTDWDVIAFCKG